MDLCQSLKVVLRRWRTVAVVGLLTLAAAFGALQVVAPTYEASSTLLFLKSQPASEEPPKYMALLGMADNTPAINPYLNFDGGLFVTALLMSEAMSSKATVAALERGGARAEFELQPDLDNRIPTLKVVARDSSPKVAATTLAKVIKATSDTLVARQKAAGAPPEQWIKAEKLTAEGRPQKLHANQVKAVLAIGMLGGGLAVLLAFAVEALARRRAEEEQAPELQARTEEMQPRVLRSAP